MGPIRRRKTPNHLDSPPIPANPRAQSRGELAADAAVHALGLASGVIGAVTLVSLIAGHGDALELAAILIYAAGLIAMLGCSAAYHVARAHPRRDLLQRFDHAAIFAMIAGTYTPFTVLALDGGWSVVLTTLIWSLAVAGIVLKLWQPRWFGSLSAAPYLLLGWVGLSAFFPLLSAVGPLTLALIAAGGVLYSVGVLFHAWERLPFQNAIWHGFVVAAAAVHYAAVVSGVVLKSVA
jgi:hemolysin III